MHFSYAAAAILTVVPVNGYIAPRYKPQPTGSVGNNYWGNTTKPAWVTETVTAYKTYCPSPTQFTKGNKTYTAPKQTWVTVTDCPNKCTISYQPQNPSILPIGPAPAKNNTVPVVPVKPTTPIGTAPVKPTTSACPCATQAPKPVNGTSSYCPCASTQSTTFPAPGSPSTGSTGSGSTGSTGSSKSTGSSGTGSTPSNNSTGSGSTGSGSTGNQGNNPAQTTSAGSKLSTSISALAMAAICFFGL